MPSARRGSILAAMKRIVLPLLLSLFLGCGDDDGGTDSDAAAPVLDSGMSTDQGPVDDATPPSDGGPIDAHVVAPDELVIVPGEPPVSVAEGTVFTTLEYGSGPRQVMDAFIHPEASEPTAAVIYIHGGGFTGGSRTSAYGGGTRDGLQYLVEQGLAYFTIDYSLLAVGSETEGVIKSLRDARRALQFIRYYAEALNIDADRIGLLGSSAGAGASLWLAFHDDMADPASADPIAQQSTRVSVAVVVATQATYELFRWPTDVYSPTYPLTIEQLLSQGVLAAQVATFYGVPISLANQPEMLQARLSTPEYEAYRADMDMLAWMSADDAPFYARNSGDDIAPGERGFDILHHPLHAAALAERATEVGLEAIVEAPALGLGGDADSTRFLLDHLAP